MYETIPFLFLYPPQISSYINPRGGKQICRKSPRKFSVKVVVSFRSSLQFI